MYKRQIYQIAESNRIEKIDSVARIESNRIETFFARIGLLCEQAHCEKSRLDRGLSDAIYFAAYEWMFLK